MRATLLGGGGGWLWGQQGADQGFDFIPDGGITFDLGVSFGEEMVPPGILLAGDGTCFVMGLEISDDLGARGVGSANFGASFEMSVDLKEIHGLGHVGGDQGVILVVLGDAIHLDSEENGNAVSVEPAGQGDGFRSAPTVTVEDDASLLLFFGR